MSIYAQSTGEAEQLSSNQGWGQFGDWAEKLSAKRFNAVVTLWEHGAWEGAQVLADQLKEASEVRKPSADVAGVIENIHVFLESNDFILITNGMKDADESAAKALPEPQVLEPWTDEYLNSLTENITEEDVARSLATRTPAMKALLEANDG